MTTPLYLDTETYSETPINNGTHRYAEGVEIIMWQWAIGDGPVQIRDGDEDVSDLLELLADPSYEKVIQNSAFDRTVLTHAIGFTIPVEETFDTMVCAMAHSLPGALEKLGDILGIAKDKAKDKAGKALIQLFCKPRPKNQILRRATKETHPVEWEAFREYGRLDIEAMREIYKKLPRWNYRSAEKELWHLDQKINERGVLMDLDLAHAAIRASDRAQKQLSKQANDMTAGAVTSANQRDKMLEHILENYGIVLNDLKGSTLEKALDNEDMPQELKELLRVRQQASKSSNSKYTRVINGVSSDGRLRGLLAFCGALRTGRWAGRLIQPQNLPRGTLSPEGVDYAIEELLHNAEDLIGGPTVMDKCSSAIRGVFIASPGKKFVVADLAGIENRVLAWLAGESWKLEAFLDFDLRDGHDMYKLAYAKAFGIRPEDVGKHERSIGKVLELMLGYAGGVGAYITGALTYRIDLEEMAEKAWDVIPQATLEDAESFLEWQLGQGKGQYGLSDRAFIVCDSFKRLWRETNPAIAAWWKELEDVVRRAINSPGQTLTCRMHKIRRDGAWLRIMLPSGRYLCYPNPRVEDDGGITFMGVNQFTRKWERLRTYGGRLVENICQAVARDVLAYSLPSIESAGYEIVLTVHDEIISEAPDTDDFTHEHLAELMSAGCDWTEGLPLAAAGFEAYRYRKG